MKKERGNICLNIKSPLAIATSSKKLLGTKSIMRRGCSGKLPTLRPSPFCTRKTQALKTKSKDATRGSKFILLNVIPFIDVYSYKSVLDPWLHPNQDMVSQRNK